MEPRARATRHKGSLNFGSDLEQMLLGFGAPVPPADSNINRKPYSETIRVLDEIVTDFVIETCHNAVAIASYSGRTKLKLDDFQSAIRKDPIKLGRLKGLFEAKRVMDQQKKIPGIGEGDGVKLAVEDMEALAGAAGEEGTGKGKGRGRGRGKRKKRDIAQVDGADEDDDAEDVESSAKKPRSARSETG